MFHVLPVLSGILIYGVSDLAISPSLPAVEAEKTNRR